jgi:hypothetical protein
MSDALASGMATKAERYRAEEQRSKHPAKPKQPKRPRRDQLVDMALPGVSATDRKAGLGGTARRNLTTSPSKAKGGPALESSATGKPSRKSTRGSRGRVKAATNLQRREVRRTHSPKARATRAAVR